MNRYAKFIAVALVAFTAVPASAQVSGASNGNGNGIGNDSFGGGSIGRDPGGNPGVSQGQDQPGRDLRRPSRFRFAQPVMPLRKENCDIQIVRGGNDVMFLTRCEGAN